MKLLSHRIAWAAGVALGGCAALGASVAACGSSNSGASGSPDGSSGSSSCTTTNALTIAFNPMYSASIPGSTDHMFQVPAVVTGVSGAAVQWSVSDSTALQTQTDQSTGGTLITVLKPGTYRVNAQAGGLCGSATLNVTSATEDDWMAGNMRYNNGVALINPFANMMGGDGGIPMGPPPGGFMIPGPNTPSILEPADGGPGPACTNCHGATATGGAFQGIEHTPEQTAGFSDDELIDIIVHGIIPDGGYYDPSIIPQQYWQFFHKWADLTPAQQKGMVVYLRSLTPTAQNGKADFGGAFGRDGGFGGPPPPMTGDDGSTSGEDSGTDATVTPDAGSDATRE